MLNDQGRAQEPINNVGGDRGVFTGLGILLDVGAVAEGVDGGLDELGGSRRGRVDYVERVDAAGWGTGRAAGKVVRALADDERGGGVRRTGSL